MELRESVEDTSLNFKPELFMNIFEKQQTTEIKIDLFSTYTSYKQNINNFIIHLLDRFIEISNQYFLHFTNTKNLYKYEIFYHHNLSGRRELVLK